MREPSDKKEEQPKAPKPPRVKSPLEQSTLFTLFAHSKFHHNEIAEKLGLSRVALVTKKKDPGRFYVRELLSVATILDVSPQELLEAVLEYNALQQSLEKGKEHKQASPQEESE